MVSVRIFAIMKYAMYIDIAQGVVPCRRIEALREGNLRIYAIDAEQAQQLLARARERGKVIRQAEARRLDDPRIIVFLVKNKLLAVWQKKV